jgi:hypothetical protein
LSSTTSLIIINCPLDSAKWIATLVRFAKDNPTLISQTDRNGKTKNLVAHGANVRHLTVRHYTGRDPVRQRSRHVCGRFQCQRLSAHTSVSHLPQRKRSPSVCTIGGESHVDASSTRRKSSIFDLNERVHAHSVLKLPESKWISAEGALVLYENLGSDVLATYHHGKGLLHVATKETVEMDGINQQSAVIAEQNKVETSTANSQAMLRKGMDPMMRIARRGKRWM